jgi:hypothetical protein
MRKVETRIKVITEGDYVKYIPQVKGCNQSRVEWWFYFMPIFGQVFLLVAIWGFITSLFWEDFNQFGNYATDLSEGTKDYAEYVIDEFCKPKPVKPKKEISYIKYP